ncbi:SDR family NAD(P)-dependent oxidoreductase [Lysinibacillus irui]|uniref:SDR family NAD(P)-dependent oxidoreductase n=1 Tax=Lysinibacillus irui TaxID=2998077 RepID=A0ABU5NH50_9BACI|nr:MULTISPECIES: SDR family NAD(P)-dependent oxidoreductase [Lysinibacillus]MEA0552740.1 SDR family NAD(P)-dependent oxidoreductase [Lysinibacillus irui]MEA0975320.1 SDR family NAD(P)-dependent oxidoreductase [Lysinibacillus irui]MEA1041474.1 SDR family NAD(P)-dependent oxidoreductase [Lysinibacillus irui]
MYLEDYFELEGKVAVITGGASGIGLATAKLLSELGTKTVILDIDQQKGEDTEKNLKEAGLDVEFLKCDVTNTQDCQNVADSIQKRYGKVDVLFNNAGIIRRKTVVDLDEADWDAVINVSLKGVYLLSKYLIPLMRDNGGSIINTGSGWGIKGGDKAASYCAAKAGVVNLTKAMAIDHGPENIRVNCICPGDTDTPLLRGEAKQLNIDESSFLRSSAVDRPLARLGTPEDIAKGVLFLASNLSAWVTGTTLTVDGGGLA